VVKLFVRVLGLIAVLVLSNAAFAVGMGGINVTTALGEPLSAEIDLVAVSKADVNKISARLASSDAFKGAGLDYPATLPNLKFQVGTRANGEPYIKVTSSQPLNEPFVSLLVELTWPSGQLLREYTFLLDPPNFKAEQPKPAEVRPQEPRAAVAAGSGAGETKDDFLQMRATAPVDEKIFAAPAVAAVEVAAIEVAPIKKEVAPIKKPVESGNVATGTIKVKRGDSLSKIASGTKTPEVSLERMLVAMYRENQDAFDGNNMNRLKVGKILRIPAGSDLNKVGQDEANKEIHAQAADWHAYRMKLAAATGSSTGQTPRQEVSGKITSTVVDKAPAIKEFPKEVVRLSKGAAPGDKAVSGNPQAAQEDATARNKSLKDSRERIALLEKNIKEMQHLIELKSKPASPAKPEMNPPAAMLPVKPAEQETKAEIKPVVKSDAEGAQSAIVAHAAQPASAVKAAKTVTPKAETPPPSPLDDILGEPTYLAGGAAALLGLGGLVFMRLRRSGKGAETNDDEVSAKPGAHISAPAALAKDDGDFTQPAVSSAISPAGVDDVDPISEADLFLNFGRDVQAEEILKDALKKNPDNQQVRLKLLSIYANRKDIKSFSEGAQHVQASGDAFAWAQAVEMGRKLEPGNPLYAADDSTQTAVEEQGEEDVKPEHQAGGLDFDLDFGAAGGAVTALDVALDEAPAIPAGLDFDVGFGSPEEAIPAKVNQSQDASEVKLDATAALDFDLGSGFSAEAAPDISKEQPSDFEHTFVLDAPLIQEPEPAVQPAADESILDFDLSSAPEGEAEPAAVQEEQQATSLEDLVFDISENETTQASKDVAAVAAESAVTENDSEFMLDFPSGDDAQAEEKSMPAQAPTVVKEPGNIDLSEINLNLDTSAAVPSETVKDAHWHDVATKLDLAKAYQEMGDASGASEILEEVLTEGDPQQRAAAEAMLQQLSV